MPRRDDLHKILIIGSGPIVIGQACEFDYSGTQACKALREEGYEVVLVNSNPATIMTDPGDGRSHVHRAAHLGNRRQGDREGAARRAAADARRADRPEPGDGPVAARRAGKVRRRDDRRQRRRDRQGREREQFKQAMEKIGLEVCRGRDGANARRGPRRGSRKSACRRRAAQLHDGRQRLGDRLQPRRVRRAGPPRPRSVADHARC